MYGRRKLKAGKHLKICNKRGSETLACASVGGVGCPNSSRGVGMFTQKRRTRASQISQQQAMTELRKMKVYFKIIYVDILSTFVEHCNDGVQHIAGIMGREAFCV